MPRRRPVYAVLVGPPHAHRVGGGAAEEEDAAAVDRRPLRAGRSSAPSSRARGRIRWGRSRIARSSRRRNRGRRSSSSRSLASRRRRATTSEWTNVERYELSLHRRRLSHRLHGPHDPDESSCVGMLGALQRPRAPWARAQGVGAGLAANGPEPRALRGGAGRKQRERMPVRETERRPIRREGGSRMGKVSKDEHGGADRGPRASRGATARPRATRSGSSATRSTRT